MILYQHRIYRQDLQNNPDLMYLFGDNLDRTGLGGQAAEMRGEPNAIGVATKKFPSMRPDSFFTDETYTENVKTFLDDLMPAIQHIMEGGILVIPSDGLGTGLSKLHESAPRSNKALEDLLDYLVDLDERVNSES